VLIAYFVCAVPLALAGVIVGGQKLFRSREKLATSRGPIADAARQPAWVLRSTGAVEFLGGLGLIIPIAAGVAPVISPLSAVALGMAHIPAFRTTLRTRSRPVADIIVFALAAAAAVLGFLLVTSS
jgi:hypothetical protein